MYILCIILTFIILSENILFFIQYKKILQNIKQDYIQKNKEELNHQLDIEKQSIENRLLLEIDALQKRRDSIQQTVEKENQVLSQIELRKSEQEQSIIEQHRLLIEKEQEKLSSINQLIEEKKKRVKTEVEAYSCQQMNKARTAIDEYIQKNQKWADETLSEYWDALAQSTSEKEEELLSISEALEEYRQKQKAVNEAINRQRAIEQQKDFYRINLTDDAKEDIKYLISIIDNIKNSALLYKLIWSEYIQKPFGAMLKNITNGKEIKSVIYKITNINTQEIYIGKTKGDISKRWTEHIKTSLNIGTVAKSRIHEALYRHWDEFTFEILEVVSDNEKLSQREKYYINFYQSNIYGYNMNSGG